MFDVNDNLPTNGKRFYLSHVEYFYRTEYLKTLESEMWNQLKDKTWKTTKIVCASNKENANKAVIEALEENGKLEVLNCSIDNLIVGE